MLHPGIAFPITVDRAGKRLELTVTPAAKDITDKFGNVQKVGDLGADSVDAMPRVGGTTPGSAAAAAGIKPGDLITAIDGHAIGTFDELRQAVEPSAGKPLVLTIERDGQVLTVPVTPASDLADQPDGSKKPVGRIGIRKASAAEHRKLDPATAIWQSGRQVVYTTESIFSVIGQIFAGQRTAKEIGGPLRIAKTTGEASQLGWEAVALFMISLSISLGVFNLLPVPLLDGGHLLFYVIEAVRGRPLTARLQEYGFRIGMALVLGLVVFATWNDLVLLKVPDLVGNIGR
jgi:regulator of sigma E protease